MTLTDFICAGLGGILIGLLAGFLPIPFALKILIAFVGGGSWGWFYSSVLSGR